MLVSKVVLNNETMIDLTADTVTPETLAEGVTAHDAAGNPITGTMKMGITSTKVWENASPTSSFAEQTIELDLTEYDAVIIKWVTSTSSDFSNVRTEDLIPVGNEKSCFAITGYDFSTNNNRHNLALRSVTVETTGVQFYAGRYNNAYNGGKSKFGSNSNTYMVPLAIYGVKGVFPV